MKKQNKKAVKSYNSYRYESQTISYDWGKKTRYYKEAHTKRMDTLTKEASKMWINMCNEYEVAKTKQEPDEHKYLWKITFDKHAPALDANHAEYVAEYLIANNIARRGEPLHCSTAIKQMTKRYKKDTRCIGMFFYQRDIVGCKIMDLSFNKNSEHNLAYFLHHKYGVLLLNGNTYDYCQKKIAEYGAWGNACKKELQHYKNLLKKFYVADTKNR